MNPTGTSTPPPPTSTLRGPLQAASGEQHTASTKSPQVRFRSSVPDRFPAGQVAGCWKHLPPCFAHSGGGGLSHFPFGCT